MLSTNESPVLADAPLPRFYSVTEAALILKMSPVTLYRAIREGGFPAVRVRGRVSVPAQAIKVMEEVAVAQRTVVDAANWTVVAR